MVVVDLFCGAGGLHIGFEQAGFKIGLSMDLNEAVKKTHEYNFPHIPFLNEDIRHVKTGHVKDIINNKEVDIIIGGPPCQGFSTIGKRVSSNPNVRNEKDPRNELVFEFIRFIRELKPKFFVMENVKGILTRDKGQFIENIYEEYRSLEKYGYKFSTHLVNMADYGVPQVRERVFIIGNRLGLENDLPEPKFAEIPSDDKLPWRNCWEVISDLEDIIEDKEFNHVPLNHGEKNIERYKLIPEGGRLPEDKLPPELYRKNFGNTFKRLSRNKPSLTMVPGNNAFPIHPTLHRSLTVREAARIQTFPDYIKFLGTRQQQGHQVGNAVAPLFSKQLAEHLMEKLNAIEQLELELQF